MKWSSGSCRPAVGRRVQTSAVGCVRQSGAVGCARQSGAAAWRGGAEAWRGGGGGGALWSGRDFGCSPYNNEGGGSITPILFKSTYPRHLKTTPILRTPPPCESPFPFPSLIPRIYSIYYYFCIFNLYTQYISILN